MQNYFFSSPPKVPPSEADLISLADMIKFAHKKLRNSPEHLHCPHHPEGVKMNSDGFIDKKYARMVCFHKQPDGSVKTHSLNTLSLWYQLPTVEEGLVNALHWVSYQFPPPEGEVVICRPCPSEYAPLEEFVEASSEEESDDEPHPQSKLSPKGKTYKEVGEELATMILKKEDGKKFFNQSNYNLKPCENTPDLHLIGGKRLPSTPLFNRLEDGFESKIPRRAVVTPLKVPNSPKSPSPLSAFEYQPGWTPGLAKPPKELLPESEKKSVACENRFGLLQEERSSIIESIVEEVQSLIQSSPLFKRMEEISSRISKVYAGQSNYAAAVKMHPANNAGHVVHIDQKTRTKGVISQNSTEARKVPKELNEDARAQVYKGIDPRKKKLIEIYLGGLKRTLKSMIRLALKCDGVNTSHIVDLQFVGKNVTMLLVPQENVAEMLNVLKGIKHFAVLETFDPLDITFMKGLPQYAGKSDAELLSLARKQAETRIQRYIDRLPEFRTGTRNYYTMRLKGVKTPNMETSKTPSEITMVSFLPVTGAEAGIPQESKMEIFADTRSQE